MSCLKHGIAVTRSHLRCLIAINYICDLGEDDK